MIFFQSYLKQILVRSSKENHLLFSRLIMNNGEGFFCQTIFEEKIKIFHMIKTTNLLWNFSLLKHI